MTMPRSSLASLTDTPGITSYAAAFTFRAE
jgi:hypothetical protein